MKGPSGRIRHQILREWLCPRCGYRRWTGGQVTQCPCPCCPHTPEHPSWMKLIEGKRPVRKPVVPPPVADTPTDQDPSI